MSDPELLNRQRHALRTFKRAEERRSRHEFEARSKLQQIQQENQERRTREEAETQELIKQVDAEVASVQSALKRVRLGSLLEKAGSEAPSPSGDRQPGESLSQRVQTVRQTATELIAATQTLVARQRIRKQIVAAGLVAILLIAVVIVVLVVAGYQPDLG